MGRLKEVVNVNLDIEATTASILKKFKFSKVPQGTLLTMNSIDEYGIVNNLQYTFDFIVDIETVKNVLLNSTTTMLVNLENGNKSGLSSFIVKLKLAHDEHGSCKSRPSGGLRVALDHAVKSCFPNRVIYSAISSISNAVSIAKMFESREILTLESGVNKIVFTMIDDNTIMAAFAGYESHKGRTPMVTVRFE